MMASAHSRECADEPIQCQGGAFMRARRASPRFFACLPGLGLAALAAGCGGGSDASPGSDPPPGPPPPLGPALAGSGALGFLAGGEIVAEWDGTPDLELDAPGMKVQFFGAANGCQGATDGPAMRGPDAVFAQAATQVGIDASAAARRWTPVSSAALCPGAPGGQGGPPYVMVDTQPDSGGLAFHTQAGAAAGAPVPFFGPYGAGGQDGDGNNGFIVGTFVSFHHAWQDASAVTPFTGGALQVYAPLAVTQLDPGSTPTGNDVVQVKEQFTVSFINPSCLAAGLGASHHCQLMYQFAVAIARPDVTDWSTQTWFVPDVLFDPGQGNIPVIDSPMPPMGIDARDRRTALSLFTSLGAPTQHDVAAMQEFGAQITFTQLENALRAIGARGSGGSDGAVAASWGPRWNDPKAWVLLSTGVGQEVFDPLVDHVASAGALLHDIVVMPTHTQ
jgi:hypothetical protein